MAKALWLAVLLTATGATASAQLPSAAVRARDLGAAFDGTPGANNAITDVPGVRVGHLRARTMRGRDGSIAHAIPHDRLRALLGE